MQRARTEALDLLQRDGRSESDFDACALTLSELLSNAIRHGPGGHIVLTIVWLEERPTVTVRDGGSGFPLRISLPDRTSEGGRGLFLIAQLAGIPRVTVDDAGCAVSVELPVFRGGRARAI